MSNLTVSPLVEIVLPTELRSRYRLGPDVLLRVVETTTGILLVPLHSGPMDQELAAELRAWLELGIESAQMFPYKDAETT